MNSTDQPFTDHVWAWLVYSHGWPAELTAVLLAVVVMAALAGVLFALAFLAYCIHAGVRDLPRHEAALEVMERLDPATLDAFGVTDVYDRRYIDVKRLAALKPLLDEESRVRDVDDRLERARRKVALARESESSIGPREWEHCTPALLATGASCRDLPRRACICVPVNGGHDHSLPAARKALA